MSQNRPLQSMRVLDLTRVLAGPLCTMMLGDLGAQVIKVERPGAGDDTRGWGPPFDSDGRSAYYLSVNRNKLAITADFADATDRALLEELIAGADVVVDNFLPGTLRKYGFDVDSLLERHPALIWCTITGFGKDSRRPGYDFVVQAETGWMSITGPADGEPSKVGVALADVITGKDAAAAIMGALIGRGTGAPTERRLYVSLAHSAAASLVNVAQNTLVSGLPPRRWGNAHPNLVPYQAFRARDREIVIAVGSDAQWAVLVNALELHDLAADSRFASNAGRVTNRDIVVDAVAQSVAKRDARHWIEVLEQAGIPCGLVRTVPEALTDVDASITTGIAPAVPGTVRYPPPSLGEHNELVRKHHWSVFTMVPILAT